MNENINKQLLEALKELVIDMKIAQGNMRTAAVREPKWEGCAEAIQPRVDAAESAIAAAEQVQQGKSVLSDDEGWKSGGGLWRSVSSQPPTMEVPDGYVLVPVEPTDVMIKGWRICW